MIAKIDDPHSPLHGMTLSTLPADVYIEAAKSDDDIGVLLRSYYLVETACENLCNAIYPDYSKLRHDSLSAHLKALRAIGFLAAVLRMADVVAKHRGPAAHVRSRMITAEHVNELNDQSSGVLTVPGTLLKVGQVPTSDGRMLPIAEAPLRIQYAMLSMVCASSIDYMAIKRNANAA